VRADAILRQRAGLPIHLHGALPLVLERCDQIDFLIAAQHAQIPAPVKKNRAKVSRACRGSVSLSAAATAATAAAACLSTAGASLSRGTCLTASTASALSWGRLLTAPAATGLSSGWLLTPALC